MNVAAPGGDRPDDEDKAVPIILSVGQRNPRPAPRASVPLGFIELTKREDLKRHLVRLYDIGDVVEPGNPRDATKVVVRAGFFEANETYDEILRRMAEGYERLRNEDRGW